MVNVYQGFRKQVIRILEFMVMVFVAIAVGSAFLQVIFRYILNNSLIWSEELTRYSIIWTVFIAAPVALVRKIHINVDVIFNRLPTKIRILTECFINLGVLFFTVVLLIYGIKLTGKTLATPSPSMAIPMGYVYLSIPFGSLFLLWFALEMLIENIHKFVNILNKEKGE